MRRLLIAVSVMLAVLAVGSTATAYPLSTEKPVCTRYFWMQEGVRFAHHVYKGTNVPTAWELRHLRKMLTCQHNQHARRYLAKVVRHQRAHNKAARSEPWTTSWVSWYDDAGSTASGWHATYGFATCGDGGGPCLSFGTKVEFCYRGCVVAVADDHGPYVSGRAFDLNQNVAGAIGFSGVDQVRWRLVH